MSKVETVIRSIASAHPIGENWRVMLKHGQTIDTTYYASAEKTQPFYIIKIADDEVIEAQKWVQIRNNGLLKGDYIPTSKKFAQALYLAGWPHVTR